ncbi:hypothetical protein, partial [Janthinobacterium sp.]|uniref:hypothetical protein n=1 Tax=Janthinobacterium sp. TaxID=1871054 RepID=UPI002633C31E
LLVFILGIAICPLTDSSIYNRIAGGNTTLRLDACFHMLCSGCESATVLSGPDIAARAAQILPGVECRIKVDACQFHPQ